MPIKKITRPITLVANSIVLQEVRFLRSPGFMPLQSPIPKAQFRWWSERLNKSDRIAFKELYDAMIDNLLMYARSYTHDDYHASEVVQITFIKLWEIREDLDPARSLKALLYTMVRNRALNHIRRERRLEYVEEFLEQIADESQEEKSLDVEASWSQLQEWSLELPERRRETFSLRIFHELSYEEIAQVMKVSNNTVKRQLIDAYAFFRNRRKEFRRKRRDEFERASNREVV